MYSVFRFIPLPNFGQPTKKIRAARTQGEDGGRSAKEIPKTLP